jgi:putative transposase
MTRRITISPDEYYHVYNRGVDKRLIFIDGRDYERFLCLLYLSNSAKNFEISKDPNIEWSFEKVLETDRGEEIVSIGAWCLMPNHFHILIKEKVDGGISKFMAKFSTGYTMFFNKKNHRSGSLFQGRFKVRHINSDRYLKYIYSYIHLNPISILDNGWKKKKIQNILEAKKIVREFNYSSYKDYIGTGRLESVIINKDEFPKYFESIQDFKKMMDFWIKGNEKYLLVDSGRFNLPE